MQVVSKANLSLEHLVKTADSALYSAMKLGKDRVVCAATEPIPAGNPLESTRSSA